MNRIMSTGAVRIVLEKETNERDCRGAMEAENSTVLAEALAVMMQVAADKLGVTPDLLYAKVATLLFKTDDGKENTYGTDI